MLQSFKTLNESFNSLVLEKFGCSLDKLFTEETTETKVAENASIDEYVYVDPKGTEAKHIVTTYRNGSQEHKYYIGTRAVASLPEEILAAMKLVNRTPLELPDYSELPYPLSKGSEKIKTDIAFLPNGSEEITASLLGIDSKHVQVSYENEYLTISVVADIEPDTTRAFLIKGLGDFVQPGDWKSIYIDTAQFNIKQLEYSIEHGLLKINIPKAIEQSKAMIFKPTTKTKNNKPKA